jgi:hypothetical protein
LIRVLIAALALAACATPAQAQHHLEPFNGISGCYVGTFDGPEGLRDERCFERAFDGRVLRDRHTVVGAGYSGETLYAWNAETQRVEVMYYASDGGLMTGRVSEAPNGSLWLLDGRYVGGDGAVQSLRSRWIMNGEGGFVVETDRFEHGAWVRLMRISYVSAPEARDCGRGGVLSLSC